MYNTLADIKRANKAAGRHFFSRESMEFSKSEPLNEIYPTADGAYFICLLYTSPSPRD